MTIEVAAADQLILATSGIHNCRALLPHTNNAAMLVWGRWWVSEAECQLWSVAVSRRGPPACPEWVRHEWEPTSAVDNNIPERIGDNSWYVPKL